MPAMQDSHYSSPASAAPLSARRQSTSGCQELTRLFGFFNSKAALNCICILYSGNICLKAMGAAEISEGKATPCSQASG